MLNRLGAWLRRRRQFRETARIRDAEAEQAVARARDAFARAYPERQVLADWLYVDAVEDGYIVTLLSPVQIPPQRSWWQVRSTGAVNEISHDEAAGRIAMPVWR